MRTPSVRKKYVRNIDFFYDRIFMRTPYACIQDDDDSFLFLEAKNFCSFIFFFEIMEAGARMREEGPATPTSILQQTRRHVHFGRFLKLLSALYHQRRYCFLVAVHIVCSVVIWGKSLIRRGSIAQVEHSSHASFSSLILVTITGTSVNAPSSSSNPSFNIQHTTD